jgi:hypothetical protein
MEEGKTLTITHTLPDEVTENLYTDQKTNLTSESQNGLQSTHTYGGRQNENQ